MKPDFSGDYVLNREASALSAAVAENAETATLRIDHHEPSFSCQGKFSFANGKKVEWAFELAATDARELPQDEDGASLYWDGNTLVFTSRSEGAAIEIRYDFDSEGRLRMAEQLRGTGHDQDNLWIFDRSAGLPR